MFKRRKKTVGLALGGGAVRGFAHLGVLQVLEEEGLVPSFVAGTSVGSLVGALLCSGMSVERIMRVAEGIKWKDLVKPTVPRLGLMATQGIRDFVDTLVENRRIEDLAIPFKAVAVDISKGRLLVFDSGPVGEAVQASCSVPGIFEPVQRDGTLIVDGGIVNNLPADIVKSMGADYVIAVDLTADQGSEAAQAKNIVEVLVTSLMRLMSVTGRSGRESADCLITPDLSGFSFHDMDQLEALVEKGREAGRKAIPALRAAKIIAAPKKFGRKRLR